MVAFADSSNPFSPGAPSENSELPDGTQVLITPMQGPIAKVVKEESLEQLKQEVHRIASLSPIRPVGISQGSQRAIALTQWFDSTFNALRSTL